MFLRKSSHDSWAHCASSSPIRPTRHPQSMANKVAVQYAESRVRFSSELAKCHWSLNSIASAYPFARNHGKFGLASPCGLLVKALNLGFQCIEKLVKNRMNAIVSRPGRGGETGRLQIQLLGFLDKPKSSGVHNHPEASASARWDRRMANLDFGQSLPHLPIHFRTRTNAD